MTNKFNILEERVSTWPKRIKDLNINISKLARLSGVSRPHLSKVISGKIPVRFRKKSRMNFVNKVEKILTELEAMKREAEKKAKEDLA